MYAEYIKKEVPDLNGTGHTHACYKMKTTAMSHKGFVDLCVREGSMSKDAIEGVLSLVHEKLSLSLAEGYSVKIDGLGTFSAKLGVRGDALPDTFEPGHSRRNAKNIEVTGVAYRPASELISDTRAKCTLKSAGESRIRKSKYTLTERVEKARNYLQDHPLMRVDDYARLTGLSRTTASLELRSIASAPASGITSTGQRSQKYYILQKKAGTAL